MGGPVARGPASRGQEAATVGHHTRSPPPPPPPYTEPDVVTRDLQHLDPGGEDAVVRS